MKNPINFNNKQYKTRKQLQSEIKEQIVHGQINNFNNQIVNELVKYSENYEEDCKYCVIINPDFNDNNNLCIGKFSKNNVFIETISVNHAIDYLVKGYCNQSYKFRRIIQPDINDFKMNNKYPKVCPFCGYSYKYYDVDHYSPEFKDLLNTFCNNNNIDLHNFANLSYDNQNEILNNFKEYHSKNAHLRYICRYCNTSKKHRKLENCICEF